MRNKLLMLLFISLLSLTTIVKSESVNIDDLVKSNINNDISLEKLDKTFQYQVPPGLEHELQTKNCTYQSLIRKSVK